MYSASVIDRATVDYKVQHQLIGACDKVKIYPVVDRRLLRSEHNQSSHNLVLLLTSNIHLKNQLNIYGTFDIPQSISQPPNDPTGIIHVSTYHAHSL